LLVPGWGDTAADLLPLRASLTGSGWSGEQVSALTFADAFGSNGEHAAEIAANQRPAAQSETALHLITEAGDLPKLRELIGVNDFEAVAERR